MQLGLYRSNYLIKTYSEKQTRSWGFSTPTSQPYPHSCVGKQSTLQTVPPQPCVGGCRGARAAPRQHHLPAAQHQWCAPWKAERGDQEKINAVGILTAILYFHGFFHSWLKMASSETKSGNPPGCLQVCTNHKALNALLVLSSISVPRVLVVLRFPWITAHSKPLLSLKGTFSTNDNSNKTLDVAWLVPEQ